MLTENTIAMLSALTYRAGATRQVCVLPLGGVYWDDELPELRRLTEIPQGDHDNILRLLGIRSRLWRGEILSDNDRQFWDGMLSLVPSWAAFQRTRVSPEDLQADKDAQRETMEGLKAWFSDADKVSVSEKDGLEHFSLTFDLRKGEQAAPKHERWWKRLFRRRSRSKGV
jgi:hypothetical protein